MGKIMGFLRFKNMFIAGLIIALFSIGTTYMLLNERIKTQQAAKIATLEANEIIYQTSITELNKTVLWYEDFVIRQRDEFKRTEEEFAIINKENRAFKDRLESLELSKVAAENPSAVENVLNEITRQTERCFELTTGSSLTESERNATNAEEFNPQCIWLFNKRRSP